MEDGVHNLCCFLSYHARARVSKQHTTQVRERGVHEDDSEMGVEKTSNRPELR